MESECNGCVKTMNLIHQYILVGLLLTKKDSFRINFVWLILQKKSFCCRKRNGWRKKCFNTGISQYFRQKWWTIFFIYKQNLKGLFRECWVNAKLCFLQSSKIKKGSKGDVSVLKPTVMAAVPVSRNLLAFLVQTSRINRKLRTFYSCRIPRFL